MAVDYDLVVIGGTQAALRAAAIALSFSARVALVKPLGGDPWSRELLYQELLKQGKVNYQQLLSFGAELERLQAESLIDLAVAGVDVIEAKGEFCRLPHLGFLTPQRRLRSQSYLLATGAYPSIPHLDGLQEINYLTSLDLWAKDCLLALPSELIIIVNHPTGIPLVQALARLGKNITLIVKEPQLLPAEEPEISLHLQACLEAEGIKVLTGTPVTQVKHIEGQKWVQAGNQALVAEEIILTPLPTPNLMGLNLEGVGIRVEKQGIAVNRRLQTSHPRIYACGTAIGTFPNENLEEYQGSIAVKNALICPVFTVNYTAIPTVISTFPPLARVGLTEREARRIYPGQIQVVKNYYQKLPIAQIQDQNSGFVKIIVNRQGQILGAHGIGTKIEEIIGTMAVAIEAKINIGRLAFHFPSFTFSQILTEIAEQWQQQKNLHLPYLKTLLAWQRRWIS